MLGVSGPFDVEIFEQAGDYALAAFAVLEITHHLQSPAHFAEGSFDDISGPDGLVK